MYAQSRSIRLTEGIRFPKKSSPGDIHALRKNDHTHQFSPYWQVYARAWSHHMWKQIDTVCEPGYLKYYGYDDGVIDVNDKPTSK